MTTKPTATKPTTLRPAARASVRLWWLTASGAEHFADFALPSLAAEAVPPHAVDWAVFVDGGAVLASAA